MAKAFKHFSRAVLALGLSAQVAAAQSNDSNPLTDLIQKSLAEVGCAGEIFEELKASLGDEGRLNAARVFYGQDDLISVPSGDAEEDVATLEATQDFIICVGSIDKVKAVITAMAAPGEEENAKTLASAIISPTLREAALLPNRDDREAAITNALEAHLVHVNKVFDREIDSLRSDAADIIYDKAGVSDLGIDPSDLSGGVELNR